MRPVLRLYTIAIRPVQTRALSRYTPSRSITTSPFYRLCASSPSSASSMSRQKSPARIPGPVESSMEVKLSEKFKPEVMRIQNDSSKHAHHAPMRAINGGSGETHFSVTIVSLEFNGLTQIKRHRLVNTLLQDEFDNHGLHALSLRLKTPEEWEKEVAKAEAELSG